LEDEINLRDLIEVLLRGKWLIAAVTLTTVACAAVVSCRRNWRKNRRWTTAWRKGWRINPMPPFIEGNVSDKARPGGHLGFAPGGFKVVKHVIINKVPFME